MPEIDETVGKEFKEDELKDYVCDGIKDAISDREEFDKLVTQWWNDWRDIKELKIFPWRGSANWSVPITSSSADAIIPRVIEGNFDIDPPIEAQPMNSTALPFKDVITAFMQWDLSTHPELFKELWFYVQNTVWSGTGFIKSFFYKEKEIKERVITAYIVEGEVAKDPKTDIPLEVNEKTTQQLTQAGVPFVIKDDIVEKKPRWKKYNPELATIDIKDVLFPADSESIEDAWENSWVAVRVWRTKDFLRRQLKQDKKELYKNLDKIKIAGLEAKQDRAENETKRAQMARFASKSKKLECFEVYVNYDVDGDGLEEKVVALIHYQSKMLLGWEKYDYDHNRCPIIPGYIKPIHRQVFGVGIPEMLFDTKGEVDTIHNDRTNRSSLHNDPILMHTAESGFKKSIHKLGPGRQWRLKKTTPDAISYLQPPLKSESASFNEENTNLGYAQKRTGVTDYTLGTESKVAGQGAKTATGIMALIREGNVGFRHFIRWMSLSFGEVFRQRFALYQQYWGKASDAEVDQWIKEILDIPGNPLKKQGMEAIKQRFNLVMTATKEDKQLELTKTQVAYDIVKENPLIQQFPEKLRAITVDLLRAAGVREPETKLPTDEEIQQREIQMRAEAEKAAIQLAEAEKSQQNVAEAEERGYKQQRERLGGMGG